MLNFPMPYAQELIYSTVARAGVRAGIVSPKQLLDDIFGNRKVIATFDMPSHLQSIIRLYKNGKYDAEALIYQHTLFPIYAPFLPEDRRQKCINWMKKSSQGSVHLASGLNASRLPILEKARYCPNCLQEQVNQNGEPFWSRHWQIVGADYCIKHRRQLVNTILDFRSSHRHEFVPISATLLPNINQNHSIPSHDDLFLTEKIIDLLQVKTTKFATYEQWTEFYKGLAFSNNCVKGNKHIVFEKIREKFLSRWDIALLKRFNLDELESNNNWLISIFRKHRKSFSYLEHILVIEAFWAKTWNFEKIFRTVKNVKIQRAETQREISQNILAEIPLRRQQWLNHLAENDYQIKQTRKTHGALYAWLYRNNKEWLIAEHQKYQNKHINTEYRYDWDQRDKVFLKELIQIKNMLIDDIDGIRRSKNFWLKQSKNPALIEKNLSKLPLVTAFLNRYSEDISDYQIRRLTRTYLDRITKQESLSEWIILRKSGLSEQRLKEESRRFLAISQEFLLRDLKGV